MERTESTRQGGGALVLVGIVGAIVGFVAGHTLGAQLTEGTLKAAIEAAGSQILRSTNGPVVLAMSIQAGTAILCAAIVPAITTLVLHRRLQHEESTHERKLCSNQESGTLPGPHSYRNDHGRDASPPRDTTDGTAPDCRNRDRVFAGLAGNCHQEEH